LDEHASVVFEEVAMEHFTRIVSELGATKIGRWRKKGSYRKEGSQRPDKKASEFRWRYNMRKEFYMLYSRSGFRFGEDENTRLVDIKTLLSDLVCH